jgi:molybdopterin converting factor small subunit
MSISHGLETGLKVPQIRALLEDLSAKSLPQPIEYLLNEAEARFARLQIIDEGSGERTYLKSGDKVLLAEIINEVKLKPFGFTELEGGILASRFEAEVLYFGLREVGFVAVRVDAKGKVISPLAVAKQKLEADQSTSVARDVIRLREQEEKIGSSPNDDDLQRQIQLAIKNKAKATFTVTSGTGAEIEFLLEPIGIANGRLRAKDRKADIERTLPIASIIKVTLN